MSGKEEDPGAPAGGAGAHRRARRIVIAATGVVLALVALSFAAGTLASRNILLKGAESQVRLVCKLIAERVRYASTEIDAVLAQATAPDAHRRDDEAWNALLGAGAAGLATVNALLHVDLQQLVRHASNPKLVGGKAARATVFNAAREGATGTVMADRVILGPVTGARVLSFGRRLNGPDGEFAGVVIATVDMGRFEQRLAGLQLPAHARVRLLQTASGEELLNTAPGGGGPWLQARETLSDFPLAVEFAVDEGRVLRAWYGQAALGGAVSLLVAVALLLGAYFILRQLSRLRESEQRNLAGERRFRALIEQASDAVNLYDAGRRLLYRSPSATWITGYSDEERRNAKMLQLSLEEDQAVVERAMEAARASPGVPQPAQYRIRHKDGRLRWLDCRITDLLHDPAVGAIVFNYRDITERVESEQRVAFLASHDALTGLPNRNLLSDRVEQAIARARREGHQVALLFVDLDRFKLVNDSWGHPFGDALLAETARRLQRAVREGDTVARLGGDEFVLLLPGLKGPEGAARVAQKVLAALAQPFELQGRALPITGSIGISVFPGDGGSLEALLQNADAAMYRAKDLGRGTFQFYQADMGQSARDRVELEAALHHALPRGELTLHYQPQVDLASGRIAGFEALMRWQRGALGMVPPARFIHVAEDTGLIVPMGDWALREACRQAAAWRAAGLGSFRIAVNLSARQFWQGKVTDSVRAALAETGAEAAMLEVEITESVVLRDVDQVTRSLRELRDLGVTVAIDDFGSGYSSLAYLRSLPIDKVKIDKSFLQGTPEDPDARALVAEIIRFAHVLKLAVVAEGVEQEGQAAFLREAGCERVQGFLFSPALDAASCTRMLQQPVEKGSGPFSGKGS